MDKAAVDRWLRAYIDAWKSYDRDQIAGLFAEGVRYRYHPYDEPIEGRDAVVASWLGESDVAVATGSTSYRATPGGPVERIFDNCYVMGFDEDGRCTEFTEWFIERPRS